MGTGTVKRLLVWMTLAMVGGQWEVRFISDAVNLAVVLSSECYEDGKLVYLAVDRMDITEPNQSSIRMRRQPTPNTGCRFTAQLVRGDGNPENDYAVDGVVVQE